MCASITCLMTATLKNTCSYAYVCVMVVKRVESELHQNLLLKVSHFRKRSSLRCHGGLYVCSSLHLVMSLFSIQHDQHFAYAHFLLGSEYMGLGKTDESRRCFEDAIRVCPRNYSAWYIVFYTGSESSFQCTCST